MLRKKIKKFWKIGFAGMVALAMAGCIDRPPEVSEPDETAADHEVYPSSEDDFDDAENIAEIYRDIYEEAAEASAGNSSMSCSLEMMQRIVARLGENGYAAVDSENQVNMAEAEQVIAAAGAQIVVDEATGHNYAQWEADGVTYKIWLEDEAALEAKLKLMKEFGLSGTAAWRLGFEKSDTWELILKYVN